MRSVLLIGDRSLIALRRARHCKLGCWNPFEEMLVADNQTVIIDSQLSFEASSHTEIDIEKAPVPKFSYRFRDRITVIAAAST